ncbi:MAG: hypothetical protein ACC662_02970, partial [Planctomycetota bacterium]
RCYLLPISIPATSDSVQGDDYLDPADTTQRNLLLQFPVDWNGDQVTDEGDGSGRVLVGLPTTDQPCEVIRYDAIDRQTSTQSEIYFVADQDLVARLVPLFFPNTELPWTQPQAGTSQQNEEVVQQEASKTDTQGGTEDVPPPGEDAVMPDSDPDPDSSGGGDAENVEDRGNPYEIVPAVTEPAQYEPPTPTAQGSDDSGQYPWPEWTTAKAYVNRWFRGVEGTTDRPHDNVSVGQRDSLVIPCFRIYEGPAYHGTST